MHYKKTLGISVFALVLSCQFALAEPHYNVNDFYQVHKEGRIYIFDDYETYASFVQLGETPFQLTRIGAGPGGETLVFGLTKKDKKMRSGIGSVDLYDGKAEGISNGFYGEIIKEGRIYVFSEWADMKNFMAVGEAPLRYTQIGAGPNGETVVYVLNDDNKKVKPDALIEEFTKKHG